MSSLGYQPLEEDPDDGARRFCLLGWHGSALGLIEEDFPVVFGSKSGQGPCNMIDVIMHALEQT